MITRLMTRVVFMSLAGLVAAGCDGSSGRRDGVAAISSFASESGTIQLSADDARLFVLNEGATRGSLTVLRVRDGAGQDERTKLGEVAVGSDPASVSVNAAGTRAYVSNGADGTISVVDVQDMALIATFLVGSEPRGTALSPSGRRLYVAESAEGTLAVIDTVRLTLLTRVALGLERPFAVTVTSDGDALDDDETIVVTDFYAQARPGLPRDRVEGFDDGKEGRVAFVDAGTLVVSGVTPLSPIASGFAADRTKLDTANGAAKDTFKSTAPDPTKDPQDVMFNQLHAVSVDPATGRFYVNAIGASPEPPAKFNVNVQALVGVLDPATRTEVAAEHVNVNDLIKVETQPAEPFNGSLVRAFAADTVDLAIRDGVVVLVSRAGGHVIRAAFDGNGRLTLGNSATTPAVRVPVGNVPNGVVLDSRARRAYVNSEVDQTVTVIDLTTNAVVGAPIESAPLPAVGTTEHNALIGKLAFFTGMGLPARGVAGTDVRGIRTHLFRGMASDNNWSSCGSCHPGGLSDQITWSFPTGPRQTIALDASYSKKDPQLQRVFNWNAVQGSITDFNNNARGIQGGVGFTAGGSADAAQVFNHGPNAGVSDALDLMTLWVQIGVRTENAPTTLSSSAVAAGRAVFEALDCDGCHGGDQWTSSRVRWAYPLFTADPAAGGAKLDARVQQLAGAAVLQAFDLNASGSFDDDANGFADTAIVTRFDVAAAPASPTLDLTNPIELRGAGPQLGLASVGAAGSFNPPSLLGLAGSAPYGHHGRAATLEAVFDSIANGGLGHPLPAGTTAQQLGDLMVFLRSIDGRTAPVIQ